MKKRVIGEHDKRDALRKDIEDVLLCLPKEWEGKPYVQKFPFD